MGAALVLGLATLRILLVHIIFEKTSVHPLATTTTAGLHTRMRRYCSIPPRAPTESFVCILVGIGRDTHHLRIPPILPTYQRTRRHCFRKRITKEHTNIRLAYKRKRAPGSLVVPPCQRSGKRHGGALDVYRPQTRRDLAYNHNIWHSTENGSCRHHVEAHRNETYGDSPD